MNTEAIKTLTKARALVEKGWVKGYEHIDAGELNWLTNEISPVESYCAIGAIRKADGPGEESAFDLIRQAIGDLFYGGKKRVGESGILRFNDRKKTTKEDVVAAFDKALELAQTEEAS